MNGDKPADGAPPENEANDKNGQPPSGSGPIVNSETVVTEREKRKSQYCRPDRAADRSAEPGIETIPTSRKRGEKWGTRPAASTGNQNPNEVGVRGIPLFAKNAKNGAPLFNRVSRTPHFSQKAARNGALSSNGCCIGSLKSGALLICGNGPGPWQTERAWLGSFRMGYFLSNQNSH
jgi:hypothetical protein